MADVIAKWQMVKPLQDGCVVADVIASSRWKNHKVNYFNFSSEVLNRTSSQTCGKWYLPTFLLRDGSLTLMYRASFIVLIWFKSSLPTMLKQDSKQVTANRTSTKNQKKSYIVVPYYSGLSESIKNIGRKFGEQVYFKGGTTIKNLLMTPKDKDAIQKQSGVIYRYQCDRVGCDGNILESPQELLVKGSRNIWNPPLPYMTTVTSLVTMLPSTTSILLGGRTWTRWEQ